jgi:hypothetical protein
MHLSLSLDRPECSDKPASIRERAFRHGLLLSSLGSGKPIPLRETIRVGIGLSERLAP